MGLQRFEMVFMGETVSDEYALNLALSALDRGNHDAKTFTTYGERLDRYALEKSIEETQRFPTDLHVDGLSIGYGGASGRSHRFLKAVQEVCRTEDWSAWASVALAKTEFILDWVTDCDFDFWQNAQDPLEYSGSGRDYAGLPMIPSGHPPPLDRMVIDISRNPGRRVLRDKYVEGVGYAMWLTPLFWSCIGRQRDDRALVDAGWQVSSLPGDVLKIEVSPGVFTESGDPLLQGRLRSALYGVALSRP